MSACTDKGVPDTLANEKAQAIIEIENYRASFSDLLYSDVNVALLDAISSDGKNAVNAAVSVEAVKETVSKVKGDLNGIMTLVEEAEFASDLEIKEFALYKKSVQSEIVIYRTSLLNEDYTVENVLLLNEIVEAVKNEIFMAKTYEAVDALAIDAIAALEQVLTIAEESAIELNIYKQTVIATLTAHRTAKNNENYSPSKVERLDNIVESGILSIGQAISVTEIDERLENFIAELDAVITLLQENEQALTAHKGATISELEYYRATKDNLDYTNDGVADLDEAVTNGIAAINNAVSIGEVEGALLAAKTQLDEIETHSAKLSQAKSEAILEINEYRKTKTNAYYTADGIIALDTALTNGIIGINSATTLDDILHALSTVKQALDNVNVADEELVSRKIEAVDELTDFRQTKSNEDYTTEGISALDTVTAAGITAINEAEGFEDVKDALSAAKIAINTVKTYVQEIAMCKSEAINELNEYRATKENNVYTEDGIIELDAKVTNGINAINLADSFDGIADALTAARETLDAVKDYSQELSEMKTVLLTQLVEYRTSKNDAEYTANGITALDEVVVLYREQIEKANTIADVIEILDTAKSKLDAVKNYVLELEEAKITAWAALTAYRMSKSNDDYSDNKITVLDNVLMNGIEIIQAAISFEEVEEALSTHKSELDAVPTINDEMQSAKQLAISALTVYRNAKTDAAYSVNGVNLLDSALVSGITAVNEAASIDAVNEALALAKTAIDSIKLLTEELSDVKAAATIELIEYRATKANGNYSSNGIALLNKALQDGLTAIDGATMIAGVTSDLTVAKATLDAVLTLVQEIEALKTAAVQELSAYREAKDTDNYSETGNALLDETLENGLYYIDIAATQGGIANALAEGKTALDAVPTYQQELTEKKVNTIAELREYRLQKDDEAYSEAGVAALNSAVTASETEINSAETLIAVDAALAIAKNTLDAVHTIADEENALTDIVDEAIDEIVTHRATKIISDYSTEGVEELDRILSYAIAGILAAQTATEIDEIVVAAKAAMDEVITYTDEIIVKKATSIEELEQYRNNFDDDLYTATGIAALDGIVADAILAINTSVYLGDVELILDSAKEALDGVLTFAQEIIIARNQAMNDLNAYRETFDDDLYDIDGISSLDEAVQLALSAISVAETLNEIEVTVEEVKQMMEAVLTTEQKIAAVRTQAIVDLNAYRDAFDENLYDSDGIAALNNALDIGLIAISEAATIDDVENALYEAEQAMDAVFTKD
jgi:hypothetical protein